MVNIRDLLRRSDIMQVIDQYRSEILSEMENNPRDLRYQHQLNAINGIETRIKLLSRGGMRVIEGGKKQTENE